MEAETTEPTPDKVAELLKFGDAGEEEEDLEGFEIIKHNEAGETEHVEESAGEDEDESSPSKKSRGKRVSFRVVEEEVGSDEDVGEEIADDPSADTSYSPSKSLRRLKPTKTQIRGKSPRGRGRPPKSPPSTNKTWSKADYLKSLGSDNKIRDVKRVNERQREEKESVMYPCRVCGYEFNAIHKLKRHMPVHTDERKFGCDICGHRFRQSSVLLRHKQAIHNPDYKPYKCDECGKQFTRSSTLISHRVIHKQDKKYECPVCDRGFHQRGNLKAHMIIHTGEKPFHCNICQKDFSQKSNMTYHMQKVHSNLKPNKCNFCDEQFSSRVLLRTHERSVHGVIKPMAASNRKPRPRKLTNAIVVTLPSGEKTIKFMHSFQVPKVKNEGVVGLDCDGNDIMEGDDTIDDVDDGDDMRDGSVDGEDNDDGDADFAITSIPKARPRGRRSGSGGGGSRGKSNSSLQVRSEVTPGGARVMAIPLEGAAADRGAVIRLPSGQVLRLPPHLFNATQATTVKMVRGDDETGIPTLIPEPNTPHITLPLPNYASTPAVPTRKAGRPPGTPARTSPHSPQAGRPPGTPARTSPHSPPGPVNQSPSSQAVVSQVKQVMRSPPVVKHTSSLSPTKRSLPTSPRLIKIDNPDPKLMTIDQPDPNQSLSAVNISNSEIMIAQKMNKMRGKYTEDELCC